MKNNRQILLVGSGPMAIEYAKILVSLKKDFFVVGNTQKSANNFKEKTGINVITGGIEKWLKNNYWHPQTAIVVTSEETLGGVTLALLKHNVKSILVEKPGGYHWDEIKTISRLSKKANSCVYIAYNRRFYESVIEANKIIKKDGGVKSCHFEFTEWSHKIVPLDIPNGVKQKWFWHNSTHVVDLVFFLCGIPKNLSTYHTGYLKWHKKASRFVGSGVTKNDVLFSYCANWNSPGRWGVEIMTDKHRLILKPLEKLQIREIGSVEITEVPINNQLDLDFKPGLYKEVKSFLTDKKYLCALKEQLAHIVYYKRISGE